MTLAEAARLLDLPPDASPAQLETRFLELRAKLEDKIAKAPTPGLKEKYRTSLTEVTTAFEILTLSADGGSLPVLERAVSAPPPTAPAAASARPAPSRPTPPAAKSKSNREFFLVAALAVVVLGAGTWWILQTRATNAERARIAAEEKAKAEAEAERQAAVAQAEQDRIERLLTSLRGQMAELNVAYDAQMRIEQIAERELSDLKAKERDVSREQRGTASPELRRLAAQVRVQENLVTWLRETLPSHPARFAKAKAEEMLSARAADEAASAVTSYTAQIEVLKNNIAAARAGLAVTGVLNLRSNLEGTTWQLIDAFGGEFSGTAPGKLIEVAYGPGTATFRRPGWPEQGLSFDLKPDMTNLAVEFPIGSLRVESQPDGAQIYRGGQLIGHTPLELPQLPPGTVALRVSQPGFKSARLTGRIEAGKTLRFNPSLIPGRSPDPDFIFNTVGSDLALISDPQVRTRTALSLLHFADQLEGYNREALTPLLEAHLEACRAIRDSEERFHALGNAMTIVPRLDFERSRAWAEEAVPALAAWTDPYNRKYGFGAAKNFAAHPEPTARMLTIFANWLANDETYLLGEIAKHQKRFGFDADAERTANRVRASKSAGQNRITSFESELEKGAVQRPYGQMHVALSRRDLPAAQAALARVSTSLDFDNMLSLSREFMRLGDFEAPLRLAELGQNQTLTVHLFMFRLIDYAYRLGNHALAEQWAARLPDTTEHRLRSRAYQNLAEHYLDLGLKREALAAANQIRTFAPSSNAYATDRIEAAKLFAILGQTDRARELEANAPTTFDKEYSQRLQEAVALFHLLGDNSSRDRALRVIRASEPNNLSSAYYRLIVTLCRAERPDEAASFLSQITNGDLTHFAQQSIARTRARLTPAEQLEALAEKAPPGQQRAMLLLGILAHEANLQAIARFQPSN